MPGKTFILDSILATPAPHNGDVTVAVRSSLLSTLFENIRPLVMSGGASSFIALVAVIRLHQAWAALWLVTDIGLLLTRLGIARAYIVRSRTDAVHPGPWAVRYVPPSLLACLLFGLGTMGCILSHDGELTALAVMVTAGILGGIASRNAALSRLAIAQICLGAIPIGLGGLLASRSAMWILVPPLCLYVAAMTSVVRRHYAMLCCPDDSRTKARRTCGPIRCGVGLYATRAVHHRQRRDGDHCQSPNRRAFRRPCRDASA
jgi:hypothetical protein